MTPKVTDLVVTQWGARFMGVHFPCSVGRGGIGIKQGEGDGITPIGQYSLMGVGVRKDRWQIDQQVFQKQIGPQDIWSDDVDDPNYNHGLTQMNYPYSHERLYRPDPLYDAFGILDYNWPDAVAGAGSAIFIHVWRKPRHPTEGCIAFDRRQLKWILERWTEKSTIIIRG